MTKSVNRVEEYRLLIEGELLDLVHQAIAVEKECDQRQQECKPGEKCQHQSAVSALEERLYDLYQEIGWSVVYELKGLPF